MLFGSAVPVKVGVVSPVRSSLLLLPVSVAAVTSALRGAPTEVEVGVEEGLKTTSCVNLCNVFTVRQGELSRFVGTVGPAKMHAICRALAIACDCD